MMNVDLRHDLFREYLRITNTKMIVPRVFLKWLEPRKNDPQFGPLWSRYFRKSDTEAAFLYRADMVRKDIAKFKITVIVTPPSKPVNVSATVQKQPIKKVTVPEFISIESGRTIGAGGYTEFDINAQPLRHELLRQGRRALEAWVERYGAACTKENVNISALNQLLAALHQF